ncbi:hypothetical protein A3D06_01015 [Candidatus Roizmanbacteria bacterium RIFCSPHIGHO2_02_FULL_40_9]|uniref:Cohesin domain-containing protein n=1 Tax=Candidatus Roizmanbacteria bacterium RIFCSPHIGHO2_02_FULL_40_9 TaxID=1802042 RepID=A0A1F7HCT4_9BACT|nr:MAG: hypothetical protein A3D06_01015 [Candidatus Roizmanbacteria bacterium RIFCSPHIGHO2_02_FULL_40_9]
MKKFIPLIIISIIAVLAAGLSYYKNSQSPTNSNGNQQNGNNQKETPMPKITANGILTLTPEKSVIDSKEDFVITLYADSVGQVIGGYDTVINFDTKKAAYVSSENMTRDLQMFVTQRDNGISVTHVKNLDAKDDIIHAQTPIAKLTFKPLVEGKISFDIIFSPGNTDDSNIVTLSAQDILGSAKGTEVFIGKGYSLKIESPLTIPQESIKVTLKKLTVPAKMCADCQTEVSVDVTDGTTTKTLSFVSGGISGETFEVMKAFNHVFEVQIQEGNSVKLFVSKV